MRVELVVTVWSNNPWFNQLTKPVFVMVMKLGLNPQTVPFPVGQVPLSTQDTV